MKDECVKVAGVAEKCSSVNNLGVIDDITALAKSSNVYQFKIAIRVNGQEYRRGMKLNADNCYYNAGTVPLSYKLEIVNDDKFNNNIKKAVKKKFVIDEDKAPIVKKDFLNVCRR